MDQNRRRPDATAAASPTTDDATGQDIPSVDEEAWKQIDAAVLKSWDAKLTNSTEATIRSTPQESGLLFLPFPFVVAFDLNELTGQTMFAWDTYFVDCSLLIHGRLDLVRHHIRNYLSMVERYGYMPNMNSTAGITRSQTPIYPDGIWRYYLASQDIDLLSQAYPLLKHEYQDYWSATHHQTPIGLATNRDLGDDQLTPQMAAEAETGLDWTPIFDGDVRRCVPLITNCALVRYAHVLELMATELGRASDAVEFANESAARARLIRQYCWNDEAGIFVEYDYISKQQLPYISGCAYWPLWAGVATQAQARRLAGNLGRLEQRYGLAVTDQTYTDPHPAPMSTDTLPGLPKAAIGGLGQLQWMYPAGWACMQSTTVEGLDLYGYHDDARRIATRFLAALVDQYRRTGKLWEKYNVVDGGIELPNSRYGNSPLVSWTSAAAVILGRRIFLDQTHVLPSMRATPDDETVMPRVG